MFFLSFLSYNMFPFVHMNPCFYSSDALCPKRGQRCGVIIPYVTPASVLIAGLKRMIAGRLDHFHIYRLLFIEMAELQSVVYGCVIACLLIVPQFRVCAVSDTAGLSEQ